MIAHIAKLINAVVATENKEPVILMYVLVIEILFNMSYNQIINKMWLNERKKQRIKEWSKCCAWFQQSMPDTASHTEL